MSADRQAVYERLYETKRHAFWCGFSSGILHLLAASGTLWALWRLL